MSNLEQLNTQAQSDTPVTNTITQVEKETVIEKAKAFFSHGILKVDHFAESIIHDAESVEEAIVALVKEGILHAEKELGLDVTSEISSS